MLIVKPLTYLKYILKSSSVLFRNRYLYLLYANFLNKFYASKDVFLVNKIVVQF